MDFIRNNGLLITTALLITLAVLLIYFGYTEMAIGLLGISTLFVASRKLSNLVFLLIITTPLSIYFLMPGGSRITLPNEGLLLFISGLFILKTLSGLHLNLRYWKHPISIIILIDLFWSFITCLSSEVLEVSIKRFIIKLLYVLVFFYLIPPVLKGIKNQKGLFYWYGIGMIIPIIYTTYNHIQLGIGYKTSFQISLPFFDEHTIYGACIAFVLPFFFLKIWTNSKNKLVYLFLFSILIMALFLSYSRASWLSIIVAAVLFIALQLKVSQKQFILIFGIIAGGLFINFNTVYQKLETSNTKYNNEISSHLVSVTNLQNDASNLERINRWICAYKMFKERPLLGFGPGSYQFIYDRFQSPQYMTRISTHHGNKGNAHSEYLTVLSESGILGLLLFISLIMCSFFTAVKLIYSNISKKQKLLITATLLGLVTFYAHGIFNSFIDSSKISILVYGSLGLIASMSFENNTEDKKQN